MDVCVHVCVTLYRVTNGYIYIYINILSFIKSSAERFELRIKDSKLNEWKSFNHYSPFLPCLKICSPQ